MPGDVFRDNVKRLRVEQTEAESLLWMHLRSRRFVGFKFRRQQPINHYIADFCCLEKRLIVELDGGQHSEQVDYDKARTAYLAENGFRVIRFWNDQVLQQTTQVLDIIFEALQDPSPGLRPPSPARGEGVTFKGESS